MITICGAILKYQSIVMSSESDSDFEGFSALEDGESDIDVEQHLSDISVSDVSDSVSTSSAGSGSASDTNANTRRVVTAVFLEPTGICHNPLDPRIKVFQVFISPEI